MGSPEASLVFTSRGPVNVVVERDGVRSRPVSVTARVLKPSFFYLRSGQSTIRRDAGGG